MNSNWSNSPVTLNSGQNWQFFCRVWPWKTIGHLLELCCFKHRVSFYSHHWIQTGVTVRKRPIWVKISNFLCPVTLKFDRWPWKTIGHLFNTTLSFVHHFKAITEFKLELQSGNAPIWVKIRVFLVPFDLEIWRMTLKNNRAPLLKHRSHMYCNLSATALRLKNSCNQCNHCVIKTAFFGCRSIGDNYL